MMKINRPVGATRQRNTVSIRRTVLYTAVVAAIGLFLAGLPVAGTTPTAQAQANQAQTEWHIVYPDLFNEGRSVEKNDLNQWWNNDVAWGRLSSTGAGFRGSDVYYTSASLGASTGNQATWYMGRRIGTQWMAVYIPGNIPRNNRPDFSFNARVKYEVTLTDRSGAAETVEYTINQSEHNGREGKWFNLYHPQTGIEWVLNGDEVIIVVRNNEASPHYRHGSDPSRMGVNAVAMKCAANCTTTSPPPPPTTNPPPSSSGPKISGLGGSMGIVNSSEGGGPESDGFQVSPPSATATADVSYRYLRAWVDGSGSSRTLKVTTDRRADPGRYTVTVTVTDGSTSVTKNVSVTVAEKYRIEDEPEKRGTWPFQVTFINKRIIALERFQTIDGEWVNPGDKGGIVAGKENLSHFGDSWIAEGAKVWGEGVRVSGNALVEDGADLHDSVKVFGNAKVSGNVKLSGNAEVSGNARVSSWWHLTQVFGNAKVFGNASVHSRAKVSSNAQVSGNAQVYGNTAWAEVYGNAKVYDRAQVRNGAKVYGSARICDDAQVYDSAKVSGNVQVSGGTELDSEHHRGRARYGDGCPNPTPTPPRAPQN